MLQLTELYTHHFKKYWLFILLIFLSSCQRLPLSSPPSASIECAEKPTEILRSDNVQSITLTNNPTTQSGFISSQEAVGYTFEAEKGYEINYETEDNLCIWIFTPSLEILDDTTLPEEGIYLMQISTLKGSKSYEITLSLNSPTLSSSQGSPSMQSMSPQEAVKNYFELINNEEYEAAWKILSENQQNDDKLRSNGYQSYYKFWQTVEKVDVRILDQEVFSFEAIIDVKITFRMKDSSINQEGLRLFLIKQDEQWKINRAKRIQE